MKPFRIERKCAKIGAMLLLLAVVFLMKHPVLADYENGVQAWESNRYREAVAQWVAAAETENGRAMLALGMAYQQGLGVLQDFVEAHKWFNLAASYGIIEAVEERNALEAKITADQRSEAETLARSWQPVNYPVKSNNSPKQAQVGQSPPSAAIREAQSILDLLGYEPGSVDGAWGPATESAYNSFLADMGLPEANSLTVNALNLLRDVIEMQVLSMLEN